MDCSHYVDINNLVANSVQKAINAASSGESILIHPGKYYENLVVDKSLGIKGSEVDRVVIDGHEQDSVIKIKENQNVRLSGLTIQNGKAVKGGGINNSGRLSIDKCTVKDNTANHDGGGVYDNGGSTMNVGNIYLNKAYAWQNDLKVVFC
jgi:nitrous oxidase accessory protein NosD